MRINNNVMALNAHRRLGANQSAASKSMERLSSGLRINRAGDDAAGLAISEKMRGQIRGLKQATRNSQDAISLIQTAEGALNETHSILQRMRELAVQASNATNTADDRSEIQREINQLKQELDRVSDTTEFNTKKLLNGNVASTAAVGGDNTANVDSAEVFDAILDSGTYTLEVSNTANQVVANGVDAGTGIQTGDITFGDKASAEYGSYQLTIDDDQDNAGMKVVTLKDATTGEVLTSQNNVEVKADNKITLKGIQIDMTNVKGNGTYSFDVKGDHDFTLKDGGGTTIATLSVKGLNRSYVEIKGIKVSFNADLANGSDTSITLVNNSLSMHIGANEGQTMNVAINDMSSDALSVANIDVTTDSGAESAITTIDNALKKVSTERSKLGAYQNRLEHTIANLGTSAENLQAAESRIRDLDMAEEIMAFTKNNILQQAATAMLAQANMAPQSVLQLLG